MNEIGTRGLALNEKLIFEHSRTGRRGFSLPELDVPEASLPGELTRDEMDGLPEVSEVEVVRHFTRLSSWNYGVDSGFYPLGSCTMKYNPKVNETAAQKAGLALIHPYTPAALSQGAMEIIYKLEQMLGEISGFPAITVHPAAGAHGELTGMMVIRAFHEKQGNPRRKVLIPDTAHGTNPASAVLCGYEVVSISSDGYLAAEEVAAHMDDEVAALMITNPNTLGLFEKEIVEICAAVHAKGGLVYCDGANMNALLGVCKPADLGIDVMHFNLHKTFSTPHGGGGPGAGPVGVTKELEPFLPHPRIQLKKDHYAWDVNRPDAIGRLRAFHGNFGILVRAYTYIRMLGADGLRRTSEMAVLNANYIRARLEPHYHLPYKQRSLHEVVFSEQNLKGGCHTMDAAKRLIDYGFHPPTVYFPLVVKGAIMIEPTETETRESIDEFCDAMIQIAKESEENPALLKMAPVKTRTRRMDEALAARKPKLRWVKEEKKN
ncbi:MAG: aminomethyl-transferring glycine dehydrogenase subunit GcvPB [Deltaproteobacteria bacterium]|nr:aminomethyl-transferring glycine dehydrogenase subunit GcvPB [Deltaproteobacteria bacterium]